MKSENRQLCKKSVCKTHRERLYIVRERIKRKREREGGGQKERERDRERGGSVSQKHLVSVT